MMVFGMRLSMRRVCCARAIQSRLSHGAGASDACASGMLLTELRSAMGGIIAWRRSWSRDRIARGRVGWWLKLGMRGQSRQEFWLLAVLTRTPGTSPLSELKHGPCTLQPLTLIYTRMISASLICSTYEDLLWYINKFVEQYITYATTLCYSI